MSIIVIYKPQFSIVEFTAPLNRLSDVTRDSYFTIGRVRVVRTNVASSPVYLPHVLGEVPAVGVPGAVLLDGQGAGGYGLGGIPGDEPEAGMGGALAVAAGYLQIAPVEEAVAGGDDAVFRHLLGGAATQRSAQTGATGSGGAVVVHGEVLPPPPAGGASRLCCGGVLHARSSCTYNTRKSANMTIFEMLAIFIISLFLWRNNS